MPSESSVVVRKRAEEAIKFKQALSSGQNARLKIDDLNETSREFFKHAAKQAQLSARGCMRMINVARTIANLAKSEEIQKDHLLEALNYRYALKV